MKLFTKVLLSTGLYHLFFHHQKLARTTVPIHNSDFGQRYFEIKSDKLQHSLIS